MSNVSLTELLAQRAALEAQIQQLSNQQRGEAVAKVRALMGEFGLTIHDISGGMRNAAARSTSLQGVKAAAKYRDANTGDTWSGRGLKPRWLTAALAAGATLDKFMVGATPVSASPAPAPVGAPVQALIEALDKKPTLVGTIKKVEGKPAEVKPAAEVKKA